MKDVADQQRSDHDDIIRLQGDVKQHGRELKALRTEMSNGLKAIRDDQRAGLKSLQRDFKDYKQAQADKEETEDKESRSRNWALIMAIVGPFISAIMTAAAMYLISRGGS